VKESFEFLFIEMSIPVGIDSLKAASMLRCGTEMRTIEIPSTEMPLPLVSTMWKNFGGGR